MPSVCPAIFIILFAVVGGCASKVDVPEIADTKALPSSWSYDLVGAEPSVVSLLNLVDDPRVRALVNQVLAQNLDLQQTALRLRESSDLLGVSEARLYPSLDAVGSVRHEDDGTNSQSLISGGLRLSWELDIWGRLADQRASALADYDALAQDYRAAKNSIAARAIQLSLQRAFAYLAFDIEKRRVNSFRANLETIQERFERGLGALSDLDAAQTSLSTAEATLDQREEDILRAQRALSELLGDISLSELSLPETLPRVFQPLSAYPAEVLARRPDVEAAIARVVASGHDAAAVEKALLPSFTISADADITGSGLRYALKADPTWALISGFTAPLFDGGRRRAQADAAETAADRAMVAYQEVLLQSIVEIENLLGAEWTLTAQIFQLTKANEHAQLSRDGFEQRYSRGLVDVLDLLIVQRTAYDVELRLLETRLQMVRNRVDLGLALGLDVMT